MRLVHVQGYLADKKTPPLKPLQYAYAYGPTVVLGGTSLRRNRPSPQDHRRVCIARDTYRGTSPTRKRRPP